MNKNNSVAASKNINILEINPTIKDTLSNTNTYIDIQTVTSKINSSNLNVTEKCKYGTVFNGNSCDG